MLKRKLKGLKHKLFKKFNCCSIYPSIDVPIKIIKTSAYVLAISEMATTTI